jgi:FkbM family methyltransferase
MTETTAVLPSVAGQALSAPPMWAAMIAPVVRRLPRAKYRLMNWLCRRRRPTFVAALPGSKMGLRFEFNLHHDLAREVYFTGRYDAQEWALIRHFLGPGETFIDVGANIGYFSLLAADQVGVSGRIVAIEADPRIFATLSRIKALNPSAPITLKHVAIGAEDGTLRLAGFDDTQDNWGISRVVAANAPEAAGTFEVAARPLDSLLDELRIGTVDLLKMDIEGAELFALQGMRHGLSSGRYRRILLELHPPQLHEHGSNPIEVTRLLLAAGYRAQVVDHSVQTLRRAAYAGDVQAADVLRPFDPQAGFDAWPHLLLEAPGVSDTR